MIVGRTAEIQRLNKVFASKEAELVVLYGRRRIGKTFLIREFFGLKDCIFFQANGLQKGSLKKQLAHFTESLSEIFIKGIAIKPPTSWEEAFKILSHFIERRTTKQKFVMFLDELPYRCTCEIKLEPFNLFETNAYLKSRGIKLKKSHVLDLYMALGGIPYRL